MTLYLYMVGSVSMGFVRVASMASFVSSNHAVEGFQRRDGRARRLGICG